MNRKAQIRKTLANAGLKATVQRLVILEALTNNYSHPTAESIYKQIKKDYPSISLSTVYNTLEVFRQCGIIRIVNTDSITARYDSVTDMHHHIFVENDNKIKDYYNPELDKILKKFFSKNKIPNLEINDIQLQIRGKYIKIHAN
ncbi:MAG: transcriptional repressor [Ignavibacteriae bacterium]|nr:transcriptional repressor [Ignavibacteriota bacterium]